MPVDPAEIAKMVREIRDREKSDGGEAGHREASAPSVGEDSVTSKYERELLERAEEALREWNEGESEGA